MANLQVRDIDDRLYESLKRRAELEHRSVSQEVVMIIESHLKRDNLETERQTVEFLKLTNSWHDEKTAKEIISDIRSSRSKKNRSKVTDELFD
ncbi:MULTISPECIES: FitA-like ribbon-helix-helix domain-containing protein [Leptospira]|uniref:Antitoxin n=3 Tax=Leptospira TaxID=171 RepID=A0A2N0AJG3_9LEPT|nr:MULTISPECIES: antitoxin [Leptospira]MCG6150841.1 antitoxin [Leptospira bandrabouensis]MCW7457148.1 antitoxin [Leptospira bandrabouensis]MCW7476094.1 antitoxin [Leptospira bandrabouensis]MCW7483776.1 antitoxin [Leptospira bandrabouensis]PJZ84393.1 antitoxin [Leptospira harrisiae]